MAKVPSAYTPVPSVGVERIALPSASINAPLSAFGGASAEARGRVGEAIAGVGDKIFARAMALQQLNNEADARQADSDYMIEAGRLHADYNALQGKDRVDAFPKYSEDLKTTRENIRSRLNPAAAKIYDAPSLSTMGRSIFNGAGMAATANKQYTIGTVKSQMDLDIKSVEDSPNDDALFGAKLERVRNSASNLSAQLGHGFDSPQEKETVLDATSKVWSSRIVGLSRIEPFRAAQMLDANKKELTSADYLRVDNIVRAQSRAVGAANIASDVYVPDEKLSVLEEQAEAKAKAANPNDPLLAQAAVNAVRTKYNQAKYATRQEELTAKTEANGLIEANNPQNMRQFLALPGADKVYQSMSKADQNALPGLIARYSTAKGKFDNDAEYTRLTGMAMSDSPEAREEFLNTDPTKANISQQQMRAMMQLQKKMKDDVTGDPRVAKAVGWMRGAAGAQLEALGIFSRQTNNKETYDRYIGTMQSALDLWQEQNKKPATYDDVVNTIGPQVLRTQKEPGWLWGTNNVSFFNQTIKQSVIDTFKDDYKTKRGEEISDEVARKMIMREVYRQTFMKPGPKQQGRVGE